MAAAPGSISARRGKPWPDPSLLPEDRVFFTQEQVEDLAAGLEQMRRDYAGFRLRLVRAPLRTAAAREQADHGLGRRLSMLAHCIEQTYALLPPALEHIPTRDATQSATAHIQAFVMNAFGCCENMAWIWLHERQPEARGGRAWPRTRVGLLPGQDEFRSTFPARFQAYLASRDPWFVHLKDFRDALAHQIPLYIPPWSVDPEDVDAYNALKARAEAARLGGADEEAMRLDEEAMAMARFVPVMQHRLDRGPPVIFHPQMLADFSTIIEMGSLLLDQLDD